MTSTAVSIRKHKFTSDAPADASDHAYTAVAGAHDVRILSLRLLASPANRNIWCSGESRSLPSPPRGRGAGVRGRSECKHRLSTVRAAGRAAGLIPDARLLTPVTPSPCIPLPLRGTGIAGGYPLPIFGGSNGNPASSAGQALVAGGRGVVGFPQNESMWNRKRRAQDVAKGGVTPQAVSLKPK